MLLLQDEIEYYLYKIVERNKEKLFIFNNEGKLISKLINDSSNKIKELEGEEKDLYLNNEKYEFYLIEEDKIRYLSKDFCSESENNLRENTIIINNNEINKIVKIINS